ncbi:PLOD3 [Symbiodinium necroappetens]|uniref:PLOD3 protein n=1 Tax=Symbiodinium necroappetens TaxID=1628268 RepID=A0A812ZLF7_9DINO|nr:PLOD3 [Symbiodinium necroappetens]
MGSLRCPPLARSLSPRLLPSERRIAGRPCRPPSFSGQLPTWSTATFLGALSCAKDRRLRSLGTSLHCHWRRSISQRASPAAPATPVPSRSPVHILSACNAYRQETIILERSAAVHGYSFRAVGLGEPFTGVGMKLILYDKALTEMVGRQIPPNEPVLLLDAWDTIILGPAEEFAEKLLASNILSNGVVLCGADRICAPDYKMAPKMERHFPDIQTPWKYPNSGCMVGTAAAMRAFIHGLVHGTDGGSYTDQDDDQLRVQQFLLGWQEQGIRYPFQLDTDCFIFQNMGEPECGWDFEKADPSGPRIRNLTTGHQPLVAHGCGGHGRWFLADIYRDLDLLEFLKISPDDLTGIPYAGLVPPGDEMKEEYWVDQPPWEFPFQAFEVIRGVALREEHEAQNRLLE